MELLPKNKLNNTGSIWLWLVLLGLTVFILGSYARLLYRVTLPPAAALSSQENNFVGTDESLPVRIIIPKTEVNAKVSLGGIKAGNWILSDSAVMSIPLRTSQGGINYIMYAHNFKGLFINLNKLEVGDKITLIRENGQSSDYTVYEKETVNPEEVAKIPTEIDDSLTLYTCEGWLDRQRVVVKAKESILALDN